MMDENILTAFHSSLEAHQAIANFCTKAEVFTPAERSDQLDVIRAKLQQALQSVDAIS